ncbi:TPA: hypothetical protein HA244_02285 [Candidatus Micrarchaeota archaeon]|nr:hypothetical protein [Candidatus Micrarchaeota archaeon]
MKILVDTNILLALVEARVDIVALAQDVFPEAGFCVMRQTIEEIKAKRPTALMLIEGYLAKNKFSTIPGQGKADDLILQWASREGAAVATLDFALKKRLKKAGVQVISVKNNKLIL